MPESPGNRGAGEIPWGGRPRRQDRILSEDEGYALLDRAPYGVLALASPDGVPYAVPISHGRRGQAIYFHCATEGHKLGYVRSNPRAVFCVVETGVAIPGATACDTSLPYRSTLVFGLVHEVSEPDEKLAGLAAICRAHEVAAPAPGDPDWPGFCRQAGRTTVLRLDIQQITAKGRG